MLKSRRVQERSIYFRSSRGHQQIAGSGAQFSSLRHIMCFVVRAFGISSQ